MLVVLVWVVATVGVTYVANAAVELVDLQVFPQGARIEVLARAQPTPTVPPVATPTVSAPATTVPPVATPTVPAPVVTTMTVVVATTTVAPTTVAPTTVAPTTVAPTTTAVGAPTTTTTPVPVPVPATTTSAPPVTTTTRPPATTITMPVVALAMADSVLDDGRTGVTYRTQLVMDGLAPFVWDARSADLPAGLSLTTDGFLEGTPTRSGRYLFTASAVDVSDRTGKAEYSIVVKEFRVVSARGGSVTVIVQGDSVTFFSALQAEGFDQAVLVRSGPIVVEVQFLPSGGDETSWVRCEVIEDVVCTSG
jgi:hypothetical protein